MDINTAIALRMRELAKSSRKTVTELARLGGLKQSTLSEIMNGRSKRPRVDTIQLYCKGCGISLSEFLTVLYLKVMI